MKTLYGAVVAALLSSICCLPAFIYIVFGIGVFGSLSNLEWLRVPAGVLTLILLISSLIFNYKRECDIRYKKRGYIIWIAVFILSICIIFYPEILYLIYKDSE